MAATADLQVRDKVFIGGEWVEPEASGTLEVVNSTSEETMGSIPACTTADADRAVIAARDAFESWSQTPREERASYMSAISAGLAERADEIAATISQELGMPLTLGKMIQAGLPIAQFGAMPKLMEEVRWEEEIGNSRVLREPVGVLGAITPWNYPLNQIACKVAPALAAGCTVVLKPSEIVPLNAFILAEVIEAAGLPAGVFNLVTGTGPVVGEAIAGHPGVDMVSFTGSTRAGRRVSELASATVKPVAMELGGKSPNVILDDADLSKAVPDGVGKCYLNSGQTCSALTRMLVPSEKLAEAEEIAVQAAESFTPGDPFESSTRLGPLVSETQRERVRGYIEKGEAEGAKLVTGGAAPPEGLERGYFVRPTVFSEVTPEMTIAQEEIFGPVLAIQPYDGEEDAVRIANDTAYGLAGGVWSADQDRAIA
ncbi:MAG TPA: aldehyde dehydrogenase family protein, partial [Solirubrobacterales bacterium]|nr:aldehyde dehydrogenase family protein [Solirubrobacterales bacterium]